MSQVADVTELIDNELAVETGRYAAIVGATPSRGSRSVELWNRAYQAIAADCRMLPFDVNPNADLGRVVAALRADRRYVGGAVTMPYKSAIAPLLDRLEPEAEVIGAVNCVYRDGAALVGANTDGAGALASLEDCNLSSARTLIIGIGGAGRAVAAYVAPRSQSTVLANRTFARAEALAGKLPRTEARSLVDLRAILPSVGVLINCTSCGFEQSDSGELTPLSSERDAALNRAETAELLALMPKPAVVFDIVYLPAETPLLRLASVAGHRTINGLAMNREQAVLGYMRANNPSQSAAEIRKVFS